MRNIQLRGHCPCCARLQAVVGGTMSKHGYTVEHGWFEGVCPGHLYEPIETSRLKADETVTYLRQLAETLRDLHRDLLSGKFVPAFCPTGKVERNDQGKWVSGKVRWVDATEHQRRAAVESEAWRTESRARRADADADALAALVERVHGQPLVEAERAVAPVSIHVGERRVLPTGKTATVRYVAGAIVKWTREDGFNGRSSTRSWRNMKTA